MCYRFSIFKLRIIRSFVPIFCCVCGSRYFLNFFAILFSFVPQAIIGKRLHLKRIESTYNAIALFAGLASLYMYVDMKDSKAVFDETLGFSFFVLWLIFILLGALICIYRNLEKRKK